MDNLKKLLAILNKYQFWIICGGILITVIVCWWLATGSLASQFTQRKAKLKTAFSNAVVESNHPNQGVIETINQQHEAFLKRRVYEAWKFLYDEQKAKNPLPVELGEDFKQAFENLKPKGDLSYQHLQTYQNYIKGHVATLKKLIDAFHSGNVAKDGAKAAGVAPAGGEPERTGIVDWDEKDYLTLEHKFHWGTEIPSTLALVAQENLWVYEAMLRVIARRMKRPPAMPRRGQTDRDPRDRPRCRAAAWKTAGRRHFSGRRWAAVRPGPAAARPGMGTGLRGPSPGSTSDGGRSQQPGETATAGGPLRRRQGPAAVVQAEYPYVKHPYAEIQDDAHPHDPGDGPATLAEAAGQVRNSSMPIEVRRVRILKTQGDGIDLSSTTSPGAATPRGNASIPRAWRVEPVNGLHRAGPGQASAMSAMTQGAGPFDIPVEIHGIIYIYNPPDHEKLGTGGLRREAC